MQAALSDEVVVRKLTIANPAGTPVVTLGSDDDGYGDISVRDDRGRLVVLMSGNHDGGLLGILDGDGQIKAGLQVIDGNGLVSTKSAGGEIEVLQ